MVILETLILCYRLQTPSSLTSKYQKTLVNFLKDLIKKPESHK